MEGSWMGRGSLPTSAMPTATSASLTATLARLTATSAPPTATLAMSHTLRVSSALLHKVRPASNHSSLSWNPCPRMRHHHLTLDLDLDLAARWFHLNSAAVPHAYILHPLHPLPHANQSGHFPRMRTELGATNMRRPLEWDTFFYFGLRYINCFCL